MCGKAAGRMKQSGTGDGRSRRRPSPGEDVSPRWGQQFIERPTGGEPRSVECLFGHVVRVKTSEDPRTVRRGLRAASVVEQRDEPFSSESRKREIPFADRRQSARGVMSSHFLFILSQIEIDFEGLVVLLPGYG